MNALDTLHLKIRKALDGSLHGADWGRPQLMSKVLEEVCSVFDTAAGQASRRSIAGAVQKFRETLRLPAFLDLKYACLGITQPVGRDSWKIIEDPGLFRMLLEAVDEIMVRKDTGRGRTRAGSASRRFLKCYQGLLAGYFDYNIYSDSSTDTGRTNWTVLRSFLDDRLERAVHAEPVPRWLRVLRAHRELLSDDIYGRYGADLAQGRFQELKSACEALLIPRNSWVWEMTVLARIRAVCSMDDDLFCRHLDQCLSMVIRSNGIMLSVVMKKQCTALLVNRYARYSSKTEHKQLLEAAVAFIGNPWVDRPAWDASARDEDSRIMISTWLRRRLIRDYFTILAGEGPVDRERLRSWLRFEPRIDDMWFALGPHAFNSEGAGFMEFRRLAGERVLMLENGVSPENNALIVRIDDYVFVELSGPGSTCTVFESRNLPFDLDRKWIRIGSKHSGRQHVIRQGVTPGQVLAEQ